MRSRQSEPVRGLTQRAEYLARLMPRLGKNMYTRGANPKIQLMQDLTQSQLTVMFFIIEQGPVTMRELARLGQVTMPTMTEIVSRLVKMKMVDRRQEQADRRIIRIQVNPNGRRAFQRKIDAGREIFRQLLATLCEKDQQELVHAFESIERILLKSQLV